MNTIAKRKPDPRARSYALPAVRRAVGTAPNRKLREHVAQEQCDFRDELGRCNNIPVITRSVAATNNTPLRTERFCLEHSGKPEPTIDILDVALALDLLQDDKEDMTLWDYHHELNVAEPPVVPTGNTFHGKPTFVANRTA